MNKKKFKTRCGEIPYWIDMVDEDKFTLLFLPGLTADHRLFEKQIEYFIHRYNIFVWDPPAHAPTQPFTFDFELKDEALWLDGIIEKERIKKPIIIGQSMGGFLGQVYMENYPRKLRGYISIDSAPLKRKYISNMDIQILKRLEFFYKNYPWKPLMNTAVYSVSTTEYGRKLMHEMMMEYEGKQDLYAKVAGNGFRMIANAYEANLPYKIYCPALLICGKKDKAGFVKHYNKLWSKDEGIPIKWVEGAGHNANTDYPEIVNSTIEKFLDAIN